jgi:hypothetical protein
MSDRDERGVLEQADEGLNDARDHDAQGLGQDDEPHHLRRERPELGTHQKSNFEPPSTTYSTTPLGTVLINVLKMLRFPYRGLLSIMGATQKRHWLVFATFCDFTVIFLFSAHVSRRAVLSHSGPF